MKAPRFWWLPSSFAGTILSPFGFLYGQIVRYRMGKSGYRSTLPVLCIGNLVAGGAGKTPTAIMIATQLLEKGYRPVFLTRGYGGTEKGPLHVDLVTHNASQIGDEAPLLARIAPTILSHDRVAGAKLAASFGNVIVMDDGLQNPSLQKDFTIAVIDSGQGIGNGRVIPAGPLRAPLDAQLNHVDVYMLIGDGEKWGINFRDVLDKPIYMGRLEPDKAQIDHLQDLRVMAFAGIGRPEKFFQTLKSAGAILESTEAFPDHHVYSPDELKKLIAVANANHLNLMTTAKDAVRIAAIAPDLARQISVLDVTLECQDTKDMMTRIVAIINRKSSLGT